MPPTYDTVRVEIEAAERTKRRQWWQSALVRNRGNIAHASAEAEFTRAYGCVLTRQLGLTEFAQKLREAAGQPAHGRPRSSASTK